MNIVKLRHEQQTAVINGAVNILRKRMLGKVFRIETAEQEFLALNKKDENIKPSLPPENPTIKEREHFITNGIPLEVDIISVSRAVEESVRTVIAHERPHIENPTVSNPTLSSLSEKVLRIYNTNQKKRIPLPPRFAQVVAQRMRDIAGEIESSEYQALHLLREYFQAEEIAVKGHLFENIDQSLTIIHDLNEKNRTDDAAYDLSSLETRFDEDTDIEDEKEKKFEPGDIFSTDGGLDMRESVVDSEFRIEKEENIQLSEAEKNLQVYLPREIRDDANILQEVYPWYAYGETWQEESFKIQDIPEYYLGMLEKVLMRKLIIYAYAEKKILGTEWEHPNTTTNKTWYTKIKKFLPDLRDEIRIISGKIEKVKHKKNTTKTIKMNPADIRSTLEKKITALRKKYRNTLKLFLEIENTEDVKKIENAIIDAYANLESHCLKNRLKSNMLVTNTPLDTPDLPNTENSLHDVISLTEYLEQPDYFLNFPDALLAPKSESEHVLELICHIELNPIFNYHSGEEPIHFIYQENDGSDSPDIEKMLLLEGVISTILERKMALFFHATQWLEDNENEEVEYHKDALDTEINTMEEALEMLSRRIRWEHNTWKKDVDLQNEIDYLSQCRNKLLCKFIREQDNTARSKIEWKILTMIDSLESRRQELSHLGTEIRKPHSQIDAKPLSASEVSLCIYTPQKNRKNESILFGHTIPYLPEKSNFPLDHTWEKKKIEVHHHLERKMIIYFFAMRKIDTIDQELMSSECTNEEWLMDERDFIEEEAEQLHWEILDLLDRVMELRRYSMNQSESRDSEEYSTSLMNKAMELHAQLDGILANNDNDFAKKVEHYWFALQRYIIRFRNRIIIAREKWELETVANIQAEFDEEMRFISLDIDKSLPEFSGPKRTTLREQRRMILAIQKIRKELFGNTSEK